MNLSFFLKDFLQSESVTEELRCRMNIKVYSKKIDVVAKYKCT